MVQFRDMVEHQCDMSEHVHIGPCRTYLEGVDIEGPHWPCVLVALSNDDVVVTSHYFGRVVEDDIAVLPTGDQDPVWVTGPVHPMGAPHQFVKSLGATV